MTMTVMIVTARVEEGGRKVSQKGSNCVRVAFV
jgi:hypothetical protein